MGTQEQITLAEKAMNAARLAMEQADQELAQIVDFMLPQYDAAQIVAHEAHRAYLEANTAWFELATPYTREEQALPSKE